MLPYSVVKEAGFQIKTNNANRMEAANGSAIDILGTCTFHATYAATGKSTEIMALVAKELKHQLRALQSSESASQASMSKLMKTFDSVFSDELSEEPMRAPAMKIHLKSNAKPLRISTARQVPLRFKEESDKEVQSYIDKGVIVKVTEPTTWCAPGFFAVSYTHLTLPTIYSV